MKKILGIFLLTFAIIIGFSGAVSAANVHYVKHTPIKKIVSAPNSIHAPITNSPDTTFAPIINSPGTTFAIGNYNSYTGGSSGHTVNTIGSTTNIY